MPKKDNLYGMDWDEKSKVLVFFVFACLTLHTREENDDPFFTISMKLYIIHSGIVLEKKLCRLLNFVSEPAFFWCKKAH